MHQARLRLLRRRHPPPATPSKALGHRFNKRGGRSHISAETTSEIDSELSIPETDSEHSISRPSTPSVSPFHGLTPKHQKPLAASAQKGSNLSTPIAKSACMAVENASPDDLPTPPRSLPRVLESEHQETSIQKPAVNSASGGSVLRGLESPYKSVEKPAADNLPIQPVPPNLHTPPATPGSQVSSVKTPSRSASPECSRLESHTLKLTPDSAESTSIQEASGARAIRRRCKQSFNSNNKLHRHIREHHARKPVSSTPKNSNLRVSTPESPYKLMEKSAGFARHTSTLRNQIFYAEIASWPPTSPIRSNLQIATPELAPKSVEKVSSHCLLTPHKPPTLPATPKQASCSPTTTKLTLLRRSRLPLPAYGTTPNHVENTSFEYPLTPPPTPAASNVCSKTPRTLHPETLSNRWWPIPHVRWET